MDHANPLLSLEDDINARLDREIQRESFVSGIGSAGHNQFVNQYGTNMTGGSVFEDENLLE